jgi:L-lactate dehydrogenase complex protein LldE
LYQGGERRGNSQVSSFGARRFYTLEERREPIVGFNKKNLMKVALFVPCYIDQFYPKVAIATWQLLRRHGCEVTYPLGQTCCGQPLSNSGFSSWASGCNNHFAQIFEGCDYIVCPSGSCTLHIREHFSLKDESRSADIRSRTYELTEFLVDVLHVTHVEASFPYSVGLHISCHGQRGLKLCSMSELVESEFSKPATLLKMVKGLSLQMPVRKDECCGFGGTFCVFEEAVSVKMGKDRLRDHLQNDIEYITAVDSSCLMHLEGIIKRGNMEVQVIHIAEILNSVNSSS